MALRNRIRHSLFVQLSPSSAQPGSLNSLPPAAFHVLTSFSRLQNVILYEYLPLLLGEDEPIVPYSGYKSDVHPGVSHAFQSAAFRFGHTMIPPGLYRR